MKALAILAACFLAFTPAPALAQEIDTGIAIDGDALPTPYFADLDLVKRIVCLTPDGVYAGTGVYISATDLVTAGHVVAEGSCIIDGKPIEVVHRDPARDFAVVRTTIRSPRRMTISCAGVREGVDYYAIGYALGTDFVVQRFTGTRDRIAKGDDVLGVGLTMLRGKAFHGQSGGAVIDDLGRLVGIVNAGPEDGTPWLWSRSLADTYLCK